MTLLGIGTALFLVGLLVYLYLKFFDKPYHGSSGAGMSGLPAALALLVALSLLVIGVLLIVISFLIQ